PLALPKHAIERRPIADQPFGLVSEVDVVRERCTQPAKAASDGLELAVLSPGASERGRVAENAQERAVITLALAKEVLPVLGFELRESKATSLFRLPSLCGVSLEDLERRILSGAQLRDLLLEASEGALSAGEYDPHLSVPGAKPRPSIRRPR